MLKLIFNKDDSLFFFLKLALSRGAPQENDAKFRFAILPQGIRQFYDNCKIAKCKIGASLTKTLYNYNYKRGLVGQSLTQSRIFATNWKDTIFLMNLHGTLNCDN